MANPARPNQSALLVASANVVGLSLQVDFPWQGDSSRAACPINLRAVTWPEGRRIDLRWTNPPGVTRCLIKRSKSYHSAYVTDQTEVIYNGGPITHFIDGQIVGSTVGRTRQSPAEMDAGVPNTDAALGEDEFYYYTVYLTTASEPVGLLDFGPEAKEPCQVTGLSIEAFYERPRSQFGGDWFYRMFSEATQEKDQEEAIATGREDAWFQSFCRFVQAGLDLDRGYTRALQKLGDPSRTPAGLVGVAYDQASILKTWARRFRIPPERRLLDVGILRRLAESMIFILKAKGTCPALEQFAKILTTWDVTCSEFETGLACNKVFLSTWDGRARRRTHSFQASLVSVSSGLVIVPGAPWEPDEFIGGLFLGPMADKYHVLSNTESALLLDTTSTPRVEDLLTIVSVTALGGTLYELEVTRTAGGPADLNLNEYANYEIVTAANTLMEVQDTPTMADANLITVDSPVAPLAGDAAVAPSYLTGAAFADRDPQFLFRVWTDCPSFLWEPRLDLSVTPHPGYVLNSGGALTGIPFFPGDVILTVASGVARYVGTSTSIVGNVLTDTGADFGPDGALQNFYLNPNQNQVGVFRIVDNTATTITVDNLEQGGLQLEDVAVAENSYCVLDLPSFRRYEILHRLARRMSPTRVFVFFE